MMQEIRTPDGRYPAVLPDVPEVTMHEDGAFHGIALMETETDALIICEKPVEVRQ